MLPHAIQPARSIESLEKLYRQVTAYACAYRMRPDSRAALRSVPLGLCRLD